MTIGTLILWNAIWIGTIIPTPAHIHTITRITTCILIPTYRSLFRSTIRTSSIIMIILIIDTIVDCILIPDTLIAGGGINRRSEVIKSKGSPGKIQIEFITVSRGPEFEIVYPYRALRHS